MSKVSVNQSVEPGYDPVFVRSANNYDKAAASDAAAIDFPEASLTIQSMKEEADINTLVKRFGVTGQLPQSVVMPMFQVFEDVFDFQSAQNALIAGREAFEQLPAKVRQAFDYDIQTFMEGICTPEGLQVLKDAGLTVTPDTESSVRIEGIRSGVAPQGAAGDLNSSVAAQEVEGEQPR